MQYGYNYRSQHSNSNGYIKLFECCTAFFFVVLPLHENIYKYIYSINFAVSTQIKSFLRLPPYISYSIVFVLWLFYTMKMARTLSNVSCSREHSRLQFIIHTTHTYIEYHQRCDPEKIAANWISTIVNPLNAWCFANKFATTEAKSKRRQPVVLRDLPTPSPITLTSHIPFAWCSANAWTILQIQIRNGLTIYMHSIEQSDRKRERVRECALYDECFFIPFSFPAIDTHCQCLLE